MPDATLDLLVVGGGIAGVGVLQAAAAAGYDALLLEQRHVAAGTSSRSSKLIHGGLRYLETYQFSLVRESLSERRILARIAPELVRLVPFHIPVYESTSRSPFMIRAGLSLYALLGNLRRSARFDTVPRSRWSELDGLSTHGLRAVFRYQDGQTDDAALSRAVLRSAQGLGARAEIPATFVAARRDGDTWRVTYRAGERDLEVRARALVNAGGPWVEEIRDRIEPRPPGFAVDLVQGAHVEVEGSLERGIYYTEAPSDRRAVFSIPWKGRVMIGTTENVYEGPPGEVRALDSEVEYLLGVYRHYFPGREPRLVDAWAGNRVLPRAEGKAFDRPRDVTLVTDVPSRPTVLSIYGGKLTGYRATAEKVVEELRPTLGERARKARTDELPLTPDDEFRREHGPSVRSS